VSLTNKLAQAWTARAPRVQPGFGTYWYPTTAITFCYNVAVSRRPAHPIHPREQTKCQAERKFNAAFFVCQLSIDTEIELSLRQRFLQYWFYCTQLLMIHCSTRQKIRSMIMTDDFQKQTFLSHEMMMNSRR
jgi:hypothetical protein